MCYYNPDIGRFLQQDPDPGKLINPITVNNKYIYTNNNPINNIDPNGKFGFLLFIGISALIGGIKAGLNNGNFLEGMLFGALAGAFAFGGIALGGTLLGGTLGQGLGAMLSGGLYNTILGNGVFLQGALMAGFAFGLSYGLDAIFGADVGQGSDTIPGNTPDPVGPNLPSPPPPPTSVPIIPTLDPNIKSQYEPFM